MAWKTTKTLFQAALFALLGYVAVRQGADPTIMWPFVVGAILVGFVLEVKEIEVAGVVTAILAGPHDDETGADDSESD